MSFVTVALITGGAAIAGGLIASSGARSAGSTSAAAAREGAAIQAESNKEALALQRQMYDEQKALQEPYRQAGLTAQNRLMTLLGLGGDPQAQARLDADKAGNVPIGGFLGNTTPNMLLRGGKAPSELAGAPKAPLAGGDMTSPDYGLANREFSMAGFDPNSLMKNFSASDFQQDPGYAFRLSEGLKTLQSNARARGGAVSGASMKAGINYAGDAASQEYQNAFNRFQAGRATQGQEYGNAFNRFQTNRTNMLQPLGSLLASGQNAASNQGAAAGAYGSSGANLMTGAGQAMAGGITGAGQATAAGQLGFGNTISNAINAGASAYGNQQNFSAMMNMMGNQGGGTNMTGFYTPQTTNYLSSPMGTGYTPMAGTGF